MEIVRSEFFIGGMKDRTRPGLEQKVLHLIYEEETELSPLSKSFSSKQ
ncbi:hypothetical protein RGU12_10290 [Fredinandcohnia sp. QZ13]|nr:hypothetical protein [Fredinandcohnia sp. QZ13]MDR4887936.1 hypothetical protein [Fredinandcohnia sp. QZ13]